jgi:hypothetical protein
VSNETSIENHYKGISPPVAVLASSRDWSISIVLYPSGPYLELVEVVPECGARISYSESLGNLDLVVKKLKEDNQG